MKRIKNFFKNFYNIYLTFLGVLVTLPVLAPVFLHLGWERPAKLVYFVYSFFCHQFATRSIDLFDYQIAWCTRDTAIWFAIFITALLVKFNKLPNLRWFWVIPFIIPMALDGGLQTIFTFLNLTPAGILAGEPLYISNNLSRFMTGAIFGIGVGWWLGQQLKSQVTSTNNEHLAINNDEIRNKKLEKTFMHFRTSNFVINFSHLVWSVVLILFMFVIYFGLVQVWNITSISNKPLNNLDSVVRSSGDLFFVRRADGVCPTEGTNLFQFECFFD